MKMHNQLSSNRRRTFLKQFATGAAALSAGMFSVPMKSSAAENLSSYDASDADAWFSKIKGKHRMVFDVTQPHEIMPFAWPKVFLLTNGATGSPESDCGVVVILRHNALGYALNHNVWEKYKLGELFKVDDPETKVPAVKNPFWKVPPGTYKAPGLGEVKIGIDDLQSSGVMFCACDVAMTVFSAAVAGNMKMDPADVKKEWLAGVLPGVQIVPSGIWAVGRAQEHGCAYCFAS